MIVIMGRNVNDVFTDGWHIINESPIETSRNGEAYVAAEPVMNVYTKPWERVLFDPIRNANPFFHFMESLWMLAGRRDVASISRYVSRMKTFSDDGVVFHGAYGHRWRSWFGYDQLDEIIRQLREDPQTRRCVLQMWDATDTMVNSLDKPCNTNIYFRVNQDELEMTVCCRSNDMIWGTYGANAVHFSVLQEYVAASIGARIGKMYQFSNNFHAYRSVADPMRAKYEHEHGTTYPPRMNTPYPDHYPMTLLDIEHGEFRREIHRLLDKSGTTFEVPFIRDVAWPIERAHRMYKSGSTIAAIVEKLGDCKAEDWRIACAEWIHRNKRSYLNEENE